jgi:hypothetical protein
MTDPAVAQPLPDQGAQLTRLATQVDTLTQQLDAEKQARARLEGRLDASPKEPEGFTGRDEREWQIALGSAEKSVELARIAAAEDPEKAPKAVQMEQALHEFKESHRTWRDGQSQRRFDEQRAKDRFDAKMGEYGIVESDPRYKIAVSAIRGGVPIEEVEKTYLKPLKDGAMTDAQRAAAAQTAQATQIESGSPSGGIPPAPPAAADPAKSVSDAVKQHYKTTGGPATFARLFGKQEVPAGK